MVMDLEKNDVDISRLFNWNKDFVLKINDKAYKIYMRLVGDAELNRARVFALRKSAELRAKLRDKDSDEYMALVPNFDIVILEELVEQTLLIYTRTLTEEAIKETKIPIPKEPDSDASLEDKEKYQKEIDGYLTKRQDKIKELVTKKLDEKRKELLKKDKTTIYNEYVKILTDQLCEIEMISKFRQICIFFGTYKDRNFKKRLADSFEEFDNWPSNNKEENTNRFIERIG